MAKLKIGQKLKNVLGVVAPKIAKSIGGPFGGIAERFVQQALGVDSEESALAMIEQDPDALLKLRTAEMEYQKHLDDNGVDLERIAAENTAGARAMAMATTLRPQIIIAAFYLTGYFGVLGFMLYLTAQGVTFEGGMADTIQTLLAAFGVGVPIVLQFFFGSSAGSKVKDTAAISRPGGGS